MMKKTLTKILSITLLTTSILWLWVQQAVADTGRLSDPLNKITPSPTFDPVVFQGDTTPIALGAIFVTVIIIGGLLLTLIRRR